MATFKKLPWATDPDCTIDTGLQSACMQAMDEYLAANRLRVSGAGPATTIQKTSKEKRTPWLKTDDETAATAAAVNGAVESCMMTPASGSGGELGPPSIIPGFFSEAEVAQVLRAGAVELWPSLVSNHPFTRLDADLRGIPYHTNPQDQHTCLFLHAGDKFEQSEPELHSKLVHAMRSQPGEWGDPNVHLNVRCIELHHYVEGGSLLEPGHRDSGSAFTMSVLLSAPGDEHDGGEFVTYAQGLPVVHKLSKGDAILFHSEALHNVLTVTRGLRRALVIELWTEPKNSGTGRYK